MSRFLFTTLPWNDLGLLTRSLPIARGLTARGHRIAFSNPAKAPRTLISEAGFDNRIPKHPIYHVRKLALSPRGISRLIRSKPWENDGMRAFAFFIEFVKAFPLKFAPQTPEVWSMDHAAAMTGMMNANFIKANCQALINIVRRFRPDIIVDFWNPYACMVAKAMKIPLVTVIQADEHPMAKGFIWWKPHPEKVPSAVPAINRVLADFGVDQITRIEDLNIGDLTLIIGTPETDPLPVGAEGQYIGPVLWQNDNASLPSWFDRLDAEKPIIWVYSGNPRYSKKATALDSEVILLACIEALAGMDVHVVLTTGHHSIPDEYLPLPDNFHFAPYLPGLSLAERCDLMIHHGGYGSCQTGLFTGTPAVIVPTFSERESNARRIASLGAGVFVLPEVSATGDKKIAVDPFKERVTHVLNTPKFRKCAKKYREHIRGYGGIEKVLNLIENAALSGESRH
jgi:UDP:flavonoid glycosyltransferase YjiC (YdhE family)